MRRCWLALALLWLGPAGAAEAAELELWHAYRGAEQAAIERAAERFAEESGHEVHTQAVPWGSFDSKVETAVPRGNGPDLLIASHGSLGKWVSMGLLRPSPGPRAELHLPSTVEALRWREQAYGWPLAYKSLLLLYDPEQVAAPPADTDALLELADALQGPGRYGLAYTSAVAYYHAPFMHAMGAAVQDAEGQTRLDSPEHVAALALSAELAERVPTSPTQERISQLFREGRAAMVISGPWFVADLDRPVAAAPLPVVSATGRPAAPYLTVEGVFPVAGSDQPELAERFAAWLSEGPGASLRSEIGGQAVSRVDIRSDDPLLQALAEQAAHAVPLPADPDVASAYEALNRALRRTQRGAVAPAQAAAEAQAYYEVLSRPAPEPARPAPYLALAGLLLILGAGAGASRIARPELRARIAAHRGDYLWVAPAAVAVSLLVLAPFVVGSAVSLFAHTHGEWTFVGLRHFLDILLSRDWPLRSPMSFWTTLAVTVLWTVSNVALHVALGVAMALVLREPWVRLRGMWRALLILPWAVPNYITALIWRTLFDAQFGAINAALGLLLGRQVELDWFGSFATAFAANLATNTWLGFPFMMVVTLGALQSIPRELEEAARIDGASWPARFRHVIWPLLKPALLPAVVLGSVWTFNMFNVIYLVSAGEPDGASEILISEAYRWAFSRGNRYGYAAAYAVIIFGVLWVYTRGTSRLLSRSES